MSLEDSFKSLFKGAGFVFFGLIISKILGYAYRLIVARLGPEEYGLLSLGLAIAGILTTISLFGLDAGILRYVANFRASNENEKIRGSILSGIKLSTYFSLLIAFLLFVLSDYIALQFFHEPRLSVIIKILAITIPFDNVRTIIVSALRGFERAEYDIYSRAITENIVKVIATLILIYLGYGVFGATIAVSISLISSFFLAFYFIEKKVFPLIKSKIANTEIKEELLIYSWPLLFNNLIVILLTWVDTLILGNMRTAAEVGIYNAVTPTSKLILIFPQALSILFLPIATRVYKNSKEELDAFYNITFKLIFIVNGLFLMIFLFFPKQVMNILFGAEYIPGYLGLIFLTVGFFIHGFMYNSRDLLLMVKKTRTIMYITTFSMIVNIILNIILIKNYGVSGAAMASGISYALMSFSMIVASAHVSKMNVFNLNYFKIVLSLFGSLFLVYILIKSTFIPLNIITMGAGFLIFASIYLFLLVITKSFDKKDAIILRAINQRFPMKVLDKVIEKIES
ncbi:flippase [Candidatus Woesearchaeota archaeon]|nr:flippase [Candidatus Woesearchaeota archaeon]